MSIIISAFCALSLSPTLSAGLLKGGKADSIPLLGPFFKLFNKGFNKARDWYVEICAKLIRHMWLSILLLAAMTALLFPLAKLIPTGFLPNEDQGYLFGGVELPDNTSLNVTAATAARIEQIIREDPGVEVVTTVNGFNLISSVQSSSNSFFFISLKPWSERTAPGMTADGIAARLKSKLNAEISSGMAYVVPPPPLPGVGTSGDVTFLLEDRQGIGEKFLAANTSKFIEAAEKRPEIAGISNFMSPSNLQYNLNVNTEQATLQNMNVDEIYATIQAYMGSTFLNNFNIYGQEWQVYMQADAPYRNSIDKLSMFYVRNNDGDPVPLDSVINVTHGWAPEFLIRQNMFNSSQLNVTPAPGYSSGQVMNALEEVFAQTMPSGMGYDYSGMSYQEKQAQKGITIGMIFAASAVFVFLILASLYESWSLPVAVFMTAPIAILGAFLALWMFGLNLNIYSEIGLIVLIALAAKNAILIVEFAVLELRQGTDLLTATLDAARIRLRPHPDDLLCLHHGLPSPGRSHGSGSGSAAGGGRGSHRRHDYGRLHRGVLHPLLLLPDCQAGQTGQESSAGTPGKGPGNSRPGQVGHAARPERQSPRLHGSPFRYIQNIQAQKAFTKTSTTLISSPTFTMVI